MAATVTETEDDANHLFKKFRENPSLWSYAKAVMEPNGGEGNFVDPGAHADFVALLADSRTRSTPYNAPNGETKPKAPNEQQTQPHMEGYEFRMPDGSDDTNGCTQ